MRPWYLFKLYILVTTIDTDYKSKNTRGQLPSQIYHRLTTVNLRWNLYIFGEFRSSHVSIGADTVIGQTHAAAPLWNRVTESSLGLMVC